MNTLEKLYIWIDTLNHNLGRVIAWLAVAMVLVQFSVVVLRYIFGFGSIMMQESVIYLHSILFMLGAGYTLLHEGHVRVDIFYRDASIKRKALVDLVGAVVFIIPVCILLWWWSWPYVDLSWSTQEGSKETSGIQAVFLLKTVILGFAALVGLQGVSMAVRNILTLSGHATRRAREDGAHV